MRKLTKDEWAKIKETAGNAAMAVLCGATFYMWLILAYLFEA